MSDHFKPLVEEENELEEEGLGVEISDKQAQQMNYDNIVEGIKFFKREAKKLDRKGLYRVLTSLIEHPFNDTKFVDPKEEAVANRGRVIKDDQFAYFMLTTFMQQKDLTDYDESAISNEETQTTGDNENE
jgi:hypothetical protein